MKPGGRFRAALVRTGAAKNLCFLLGLATLIAVWEALARAAGSEIVLPPPARVAREAASLCAGEGFYRALGASGLRLAAGLLISVPAGVFAGAAAGLSPLARAFFAPLFAMCASTPVISVILIAYLALGAEKTPVFTVFLLVFPVMAANTMEGVKSADPLLREAARAYRLSRGQRFRRLYLPALVPFLSGGLRSALSLGWKVVVTAEVLVQPAAALGTGLQQAKANLETPEVFAWTCAVVLAAALCDAALGLAAFAARYRMPKSGAGM